MFVQTLRQAAPGTIYRNSAMFSLPELNYSYQALEPFIDSQTMHLHHTAHHQTYINKLNEALQNKDADIIQVQREAAKGPVIVRNNGGGHYNHSLFWKWMAPVGSCNVAPSGALKSRIEDRWGSVEEMKKEFNAAAAARFGSGWAWLAVDPQSGALEILSTANQDNPLMEGVVEQAKIPILGLDVWEHAYYLKYQNRRPEYIQQWWNVVNWDKVVEGYEQYASKGQAVPMTL